MIVYATPFGAAGMTAVVTARPSRAALSEPLNRLVDQGGSARKRERWYFLAALDVGSIGILVSIV